LMFIYKDEHDV